MIRISLTTWFARDERDEIVSGHGVVGHLTEEQYNIARGWIYQMAQWTDENRKKDGEPDDES